MSLFVPEQKQSATMPTMNKESSSAPTSRRYHRYCVGCGWGFTFGAWQSSRFCPRCGEPLQKGDHHGKPRHQSGHRRCSSAEQATAEKPRSLEAEVLPPRQTRTLRSRGRASARLAPKAPSAVCDKWTVEPPAPSSVGVVARARETAQWIQENPYLAATAGATLGIAGMAGGTALTAAGAQIVALGSGITTASAIIGFLGLLGGSIRGEGQAMAAGMMIALTGGLVGTAITCVGALAAALGAALSAAGLTVTCLSGILALARTGQLAWKHREQIRQLMHDVRARLTGGTRIPANNLAAPPSAMSADVRPLVPGRSAV